MVKEFLKTAIKKVTLELIYQAVDERTEEIIVVVNDIKKRQEDDFRYLIQKIDTDIGQLRNEVKSEINQLKNEVKNEISQLRGDVESRTNQLRTSIDQLNQRIDTVIQLLVNIKQDQK
mgnify:CR=1 FL=1